MEQLVGVHHHHHHHHSLSPRTPRTPTRAQAQPLLHHLPSNRSRDPQSQIHAAVGRILRATPPFFLVLLAAVYLLASVTIFSAPTPLLRLRGTSPRPLLLSMPAPPPAPEFFELHGGRLRVRLTNVGAAVTSLLAPDKNGAFFYPPRSFCLLVPFVVLNLLANSVLLVILPGVLADVVLGFDSLDPYLVSP
jgi:aldose 1-epimerase